MIYDLKRYDIVLVDFGTETVGSEQGGIRPSVIVQNDSGNIHSSTTLVMPLTKQIKRIEQPTHTLITKGRSKGLFHDSMVLGECMRQISEKRIIKHLGIVTDNLERDEIKRVYLANFGD